MKTIHPTIADAIKPFLEPIKLEEISQTDQLQNIKDALDIAQKLLKDKKLLTDCVKRIAELAQNMTPKSTAEVIVDDIIDTMNQLS